MNYAGKFDATFPADGSGQHPDGHRHVETFSKHATHAPADAIIVPDAQLLFHGDFKRAGVDLILSSDDRELVLHDYFKGEKRAALSSPDGAHLTGDIVNALTGHTEYAQADGSASAGHVIGHVTKLVGSATAIRNGVSIILNMGENVEKGDVVQSGSDSTLGITFIDGTVFGLSSNAKMVLNEMIYDPNGSNNSSLISLVAGTISFVAGETAKHGDMKVDTPVATMGIRGTAVLVEIDFSVPGQGGAPDAKFQVLVEPDGHTGSYILFDKTTLAPIATVNQAGQQINISQGQISITNAPLPPDIQKLITDVFSLKFTDLNPQQYQHFTDSVIPQSLQPIILANGTTATPVVVNLVPESFTQSLTQSAPVSSQQHIAGPPQAVIIDASGHPITGVSFPERTGKNADFADSDGATVKVNFVDVNAGDTPTVSAHFTSFTYQNALHQDVTAALNAKQLADIAAVEAQLVLAPDPGNNNNGFTLVTYSLPDADFDFLAAGETLQLTYTITVANNFALNNETTPLSFTITVTGANDVPVITTGPQTVNFVAAGKGTPGGNLTPTTPISGTLAFKDVDLTDTHTIVSTNLTSASLVLGGKTLDKAALDLDFPSPMGVFEGALSAFVANDSTGTGAGTVNWNLALIKAFNADFVPQGETLTLTYTVTLQDSQGAISTQEIVVNIPGNNTPAFVWIETTDTAPTDAAPGDWNGGANWETGTVPTANDDAIIITDQLQGKTPNYPVTIKSAADGGVAAFAKSVTMNDFQSTAPELDNYNTLTIGGGGLSLSADSILKNFGHLNLGGIAEILNHSVLQNSGSMTLAHGGDFQDSSSITNSGMIEVAGGALNVSVDVANGGGNLNVDGGAKLVLSDAKIDSGTITNNAGGEIDLTGAAILSNGSLGNFGQIIVSGIGNELLGETVTVNNAIEVQAGAALLIDPSTIDNSGGSITVDSTATLTLTDVGISGGILSNSGTVNASGASAFTGVATTNNAGDLLEVTGGELTVNGGSVSNAGEVEVVAGTLDLESLTVSNTSSTASVQVDAGAFADLEAATISGGILNNSGTFNSTGSSFLTSVATTNASSGLLEVTGGELTVNGGSVSNAGGIEVVAGTLDLESLTVSNSSDTASVQVDGGAFLDLESANISGGTLENAGTMEATSGTSTISDATSFTNDGTLKTVGAELDLVNTTVINNDAITVDVNGPGPSGILNLQGATISGGTVSTATSADVIEATSGTNAIDGAIINNAGTLEATGGTLTIDAASTVHNTGMFEANGGKLIVDTALSGSAEIVGASTLELGANATVATPDPYGSANISFAATAIGTLKLDHSEAFHGKVSGLDDNTLDLGDITSGGNTTVTYSGSTANGTLTIVNNADPTQVAHIQLIGDYTGSHWFATSDGPGGGTDVVEIPGAITAGLDSNGNPSEGSAVTASITDGGHSVSGATYEWQIWDTDQQKWIDGSGTGVASATYIPGEQDEGHLLQVSLTFSDAIGNVDHTTVSAGTVHGVADTPILTADASAGSTTEDTATVLSGLSVQPGDGSDNDNADSFTATLYVEHGTLGVGDGEFSVTVGGGDGHDGADALTITGTLADVNAALAAVNYTPAGEFEGTDTVHFTALSTEEAAVGGNVSAAAPETTASITVNGTADTPVVTASESAGTTVEDVGTVLSGLSVSTLDGSDNDNADSFTATLYVEHGTLGVGDGEFSVTVGGGDGHDGADALTITGTLADVNAALAAVNYTPAGEFEGTDTVHFTALSTEEAAVGGNVSAAATAVTASITVNGTADTPVVTASESAGTTVEDVGTVLSGLSVSTLDGSDNDNADSFTATLYVEHGTLGVGDGEFSVTVGGGDGHDSGDALTITGTLADVNAALAAVNYTPAGEFEGTDTVHFTALSTEEATVGGNVSAAATAVTASITVNGTADTPVVTASESAGTTVEDVGTVLSGLSVSTLDGSDNDNADSFTATLYVEHGTLGVGDGEFSVTVGGGDGHDGADALTITGTLADVNAALAAVNYTPAGEFEGTDTVHFTALSTEEATVGGNVSAAAPETTASITVNGTADTPVVTASESAGTTVEDVGTVLSGLSVSTLDGSDNDNADSFTATLYVEHGTLGVGDGEFSVTVGGGDGHDGADALTITGTLADVNAALAAVNYTPAGEFEGTDTVHFTALSTEEAAVGGNVSAAATAVTATITVNGVPETPVVSTPDAKTTTENHAAIALTGLTVTPADASTNDADDTFNVTLSVNDGALALASHTGLKGTFSGASITFFGSLAAVNDALTGVSYTPASEFEGQDTLTFTSSTTEEASAGGGTSVAASHTATITVNPVAEAGTASAPATLTLTENATNVPIGGVSVGPLAEDGDDTVSAVLTVGHGTLLVGGLTGVTVTNNGAASITVAGSAASVNTVLAGLTYTPTTEFNGSDSLHVTVTSKDGSSTSATQGTASTAIRVNDGPNDLVATLDSTTAQQGATMHVLGVKDGGITVTTGLSYKWQDSSDNGNTWKTVGTNSSYTPGESDEGNLMQLVVTYVDAGGTESSTYGLGMPNDLAATLDSTTAQQGVAIHVTGVNDGGTTVSRGLSYAWQVSSDSGQHWTTVGTNSSYTPVAGNAGEMLQVVVTYVDTGEHESATDSLGIVAAAKVWNGGSHNWQTGSDWTSSGAPTSSDDAVIGVSGTYTVSVSQDAFAHSLILNDAGAKVEILSDDTLTLGGNLTNMAGNLQIDSGGTLKEIAASATITGAFTDNGAVEAAGGKLEIASTATSGTGTFKIDAGATLQLDHADALGVTFAASTGELILLDPAHFTGKIAGITGSGEVLDLHGFAAGTTTAKTGAGSYNHFTNTTTLTVTDSSDHVTETFKLTGDLSGSSWTVSDDHNGGVKIVDPPAPLGQAIAGGIMNDPGPAASQTIVATAANQTLTGTAASDNFVFNFSGVGRDTVTDFHPGTDSLSFKGPIFASAEAAFNATQDDGHGSTVVSLDGHDAVILNGIIKAQLHTTDFHVV